MKMIRINYIVWGIITLSMLNSCTQSGYRIDGEFAYKTPQSVIIQEIKIREMTTIDSITELENGKFRFTGELENPTFFVIRTDENKIITLLIEPHERVKLDIDDSGNVLKYAVTGSKGSELIKELNDMLYFTTGRIDSLGKVYRETVNETNMVALKHELDSIHTTIVRNHKDFLVSFIKTNYTSLATIPAIFQQYAPQRYFIHPIEDFNLFEMIDSSLMAQYSNLEQVKSLNAYIGRNKRQIQESKLNQQILGIGAIAPNIVQLTPNGDTLALASLRGKYVLLDFWASWCKPCRIENPNLVANYSKYKDKGFEIYQVSLDQTKEAWLQAINTDKLTWHHVSDLQYWNSGPARLYNVRSIPASFLLDKEGKIIATNLRGAALGAKLAEIFAH